jgi:hypothetical protein
MRIELMARKATRLTNADPDLLDEAINSGVGCVLVFLNVVSYQHGLENVFDNKCRSFDMLGYLATSLEPGLPMPPKLFIGTDKSSMFGGEGYDIEEFHQHLLLAPHCFISNSILALTNVSDKQHHQFRNCHGIMSEIGLRNHLVKCIPCATLPQLSCAILGHLDLVGAGHTSDSERVRIADNLGVLVVVWALSDLRCYDEGSAEYMLSGQLRDDLIAVAKMLRFHSKVIWVIGGHGPTYGLSSSFAAVQAEVCSLLRLRAKLCGQVLRW